MAKLNKLRDLSGPKGAFGNTVYIKDIFPGYLEGWTNINGKKTCTIHKYFAKVPDKVLVGGKREDGSIMTKEMEVELGRELRKMVWNGNTPDFYKVEEKLDGKFFSDNPKKFDMVLISEKPMELTERSKELKENIPVTTNEFTVQITVGQLKGISKAVIEEPIPTEIGKDGKEYAKRGWEDDFKDKLKGKFFKLGALPSGKKTGDKNQYDVYDFNYKEGKEFAIVTDEPIKDSDLDIFDDKIPF